MPFGWVSAAASIGSALIGSNASQSAADTQAASASAATSQQKAMFDQTTANVAPWLSAGQESLQGLMSGVRNQNFNPSSYSAPTQVGSGPQFQQYDLGPKLNQLSGSANLGTVSSPAALQAYQQYTMQNPYQSRGDFTMDKFHEDPGYQFQLQQGQNALSNASSISGGMNSNNLKGLLGYSQGLANQDYQQAFGNYQTEAGRSLNEYQTNLQDYMTQFGIGTQITGLNNQNITQNLNNQLSATGFNNGVGEQRYQDQQAQQTANNAITQKTWDNSALSLDQHNQTAQQAYQNATSATTANNAANIQNTALNNQNKQQEYANLASLSQMGLGAGLQQGQISSGVGQSIGSNIIGAGNAQAAGTVGSANALTGGISSAYNNYLQQQLMQQYNGGVSGIGSSASYANNDFLTS